MPLDKTQAKILHAHLVGKQLHCPACGNKQWNIVEIMSEPVHTAGTLTTPIFLKVFAHNAKDAPSFLAPKGTSTATGLTFPVAVVSCTNCFFIMQFAWRPIVERAARGE